MSLEFRKMREEDLDEVYEIEQSSFSDPWPQEFFKLDFMHDDYVAIQGKQVAGYLCALQVLDECTIANISVKPSLRRQGIAEYLFQELYKIMDKRDVRFYYLEVRASNTAAYSLYIKLGFSQIGIRKGYYHNPVEDAVVMSLERKLN